MRDFRGQSSVKTWISRIAVNTAYDHLRRKGVNSESEELDEERLGASFVEPPDARADQALHRALAALSVPHREVLVLHVIEENSVEETAEILQMSVGTVKSRLFHARRNLRRILEKRGIKYE